MAFLVCLEPFKINHSDRTRRSVKCVEWRNITQQEGADHRTIFKQRWVLLMGWKMTLQWTFIPNQPILDNLGTFDQTFLECSFSHCWSVFKMLLILQQQNKTQTHTSLHFWLDSNSMHSTLLLDLKIPSAVFTTRLSPHHGCPSLAPSNGLTGWWSAAVGTTVWGHAAHPACSPPAWAGGWCAAPSRRAGCWRRWHRPAADSAPHAGCSPHALPSLQKRQSVVKEKSTTDCTRPVTLGSLLVKVRQQRSCCTHLAWGEYAYRIC